MEVVTDFQDPEAVFAGLRRLVERSGRPLSFPLVEGVFGPLTMRWPEILDWVAEANAEGLPMKAQVIGRAIGFVLGHELTFNPFYSTATYRAFAHLPLERRVVELRRPEVRARILAEPIDRDPGNVLGVLMGNFDRMFQLGDPPDYEPAPESSLIAEAQHALSRRGQSATAATRRSC